jgi:hypothetical protein
MRILRNISDDLEDNDNDLDSVDHHHTVCEFPDPVVVSADLTLFNGARQALAKRRNLEVDGDVAMHRENLS